MRPCFDSMCYFTYVTENIKTFLSFLWIGNQQKLEEVYIIVCVESVVNV